MNEGHEAPLAAAETRVIGQPRATRRPETERLYIAEWTAFVAWCRAAGRTSLPAAADTLAAYLLAVAPGVRRGTIGRKRAAIRAMHRKHGLPLPVLDPLARAAIRRVAILASRVVDAGSAEARSPSAWVRLAVQCPRDLAGLRDRALLLLMASGKAIGEEILGLKREQISFTEAGAEIRLDRATLEIVLICRHSVAACPVRALEDWLQASDTRFGPIFRKVDRWGNVEHDRLGPDGLRRIVERRKAAKASRSKPR